MSIALMGITDAPPGAGKNTPRLDYLRRTLASADRHLFGDVSDRFIVADCAGNTQFLHAVEDVYHWSNNGAITVSGMSRSSAPLAKRLPRRISARRSISLRMGSIVRSASPSGSTSPFNSARTLA